ncbi:MAG: twin-arginine translocation signal domain-containing protein, partial [Anaerolineae bacterium]|nr:twin-arginine translocation signal domain-containing protein [Anaerolineae bacterium]
MSNTQLTRRKVLGGLGLAGIAGGSLLARQAIAVTNAEAERVEQRRLQAQNHRDQAQQPRTAA